ncbi:KilA-N domain-containing protein [Histophilus somni]|uniref:KilA-N domain-containing protein n=1 Tax=Histophilus somni TaxID=731 RepID=UPI00094B6E2A|nr:KilA-N domain-containing protein [Histophilus somni]
MTNLAILNNSIRTLNNLYSLADLHRASGNDPKHRPTYFLRNDQTKALIAEIESENPTCEKSHSSVLIVKNGIGTYACKEIVIAYAAWISPQFHLVVLRAFLNQLENQTTQLKLPMPEPKFTLELTESELKKMIDVWMLFTRFAESVEFLLKKIKPIIISDIFNSVELNLNWTKKAIKDTLPLIDKLLEVKNKNKTQHSNQKRRLQRYKIL